MVLIISYKADELSVPEEVGVGHGPGQVDAGVGPPVGLSGALRPARGHHAVRATRHQNARKGCVRAGIRKRIALTEAQRRSRLLWTSLHCPDLSLFWDSAFVASTPR